MEWQEDVLYSAWGLPYGYFVKTDGTIWSAKRRGRGGDGPPRQIFGHNRKRKRTVKIKIWRKGIDHPLSHIIWNTFNPDDLLPNNWHIHHIDHDYENNALSNLQKMHPLEHSHYHGGIRGTLLRKGHLQNNFDAYNKKCKEKPGYWHERRAHEASTCY